MCRNIANNINFHYKTNSVEINHQMFQYIQKNLLLAHFQSIFPILGATNVFNRKSSTLKHNFIWVSSSISKFRKTDNSKKMPGLTEDGRMYRRMDGRTGAPYFIGNFWLLLGVQKVKRNLMSTGPTKIGDSLKK